MVVCSHASIGVTASVAGLFAYCQLCMADQSGSAGLAKFVTVNSKEYLFFKKRDYSNNFSA